MKKVSFLIISALLLSANMSWGQEYPIHITEDGHIIVQVQLSDSISGNFILDTGAGANVISGNMFNKIESQVEKAGFFTGFRHDGDRLDGEIFKIPYLKIGTVSQFHPLVGVYPPLDDYGVDGLLSLKFFEDKPFTIDFKNKTLKFLTQVEAGEFAEKYKTIPIKILSHAEVSLDILIPLTLNKTLIVDAVFDTGSGFNVILVNQYFIDALGLDNTKMTPQTYTTPLSGTDLTDLIIKLDTVAIHKLPSVGLKHCNVVFREGLIYEALIGSSLFKDSAITINLGERSITIHP